MRTSDRHHEWVEWDEADLVYVGRCPDLITGMHGNDPVTLYGELRDVVEDVASRFIAENRELPAPRTRPVREGF